MFPNLDFITRAEEHSCVLVVNNAAEHCPELRDALGDWINGTRESEALPGGFARFVSTSHQFRRHIGEAMRQQIASASADLIRNADASASPAADNAARTGEAKNSGKGPNLHFSATRGFDAYVQPLRKILDNLTGILRGIATYDSVWSRRLLERQFNYQNLMTVAVGCEIFERARDWVHSRDQRRRGSFQSIAVVKRLNDAFRRDLDALVGGESPLILAEGNTTGVARKVLEALRGTLIVCGGSGSHMAASWPAAWGDRMKPVAIGRLFVRWIKQYMLQLFPSEALQMHYPRLTSPLGRT